MKVYRVKGKGSVVTWVEILEEQEDEVYLLVTKQVGTEQRVSRDRISRHLFQVCLETGYLTEANRTEQSEPQKLSA